MRDHDALGPPGTSGSEDEVGEIVRMHIDRGVARIIRDRRFVKGVDSNLARRNRRDSGAQVFLGYQDRRPGFLEYRSNSIHGMVGVER